MAALTVMYNTHINNSHHNERHMFVWLTCRTSLSSNWRYNQPVNAQSSSPKFGCFRSVLSVFASVVYVAPSVV